MITRTALYQDLFSNTTSRMQCYSRVSLIALLLNSLSSNSWQLSNSFRTCILKCSISKILILMKSTSIRSKLMTSTNSWQAQHLLVIQCSTLSATLAINTLATRRLWSMIHRISKFLVEMKKWNKIISMELVMYLQWDRLKTKETMKKRSNVSYLL